MKTKHFLLMLVALFIAIGASASISGTAALQTRRRLTSEQRAKIRENAREKAIQDSLAEVARQDSIMRARQARRERIDRARVRNASRGAIGNAAKGSSETEETADIDVSAKSGETTKTTVSKSTTQPTQTTVNELNKEKEASNAKEGAYGKASRPSTGTSTSNNQQATGQRPPTGTSTGTDQKNTGSRPSSSSNTGSRPSSTKNTTEEKTGGRSIAVRDKDKQEGNQRKKTQEEIKSERGGIKMDTDDRSTGERERKRSETHDNHKHMVPVDRPKEFRDGFAKYASRDNAAALTQTPYQDKALPSVIVNDHGEAFIVEFNAEHDESTHEDVFMMPTKTDLYPGALVWADEDLANGNPTPVGLAAGTVTLILNFDNGGESTRTGVINDLQHVTQAIREMLRQNSGNYTPPMNTSLKMRTYSSASKMAFDLNVSANFLTSAAKVNLSTTSSESHLTEVADYTEGYYTVTAQIESDKSKHFGENVRWSAVEKLIEQNGPIAMITSVTYGRRAYRFKEYKTSDFSFKGSQSGKGGGIKAEVGEEITKSSSTTNEWMYIKGGGASLAKDIYKGEVAIREAISNAVGTAIGPNNQGVPLTYETRFLASGRSCTIKSTTDYKETRYIKCPKTVAITVKNRAYEPAGENIKIKFMYNVICVTGNANSGYSYRILKGSGSGEDAYADYTEMKLTSDQLKTKSLPTNDVSKFFKVDLNNCYIYGPLHYTIRSRPADVAGVKFQEDDSNYIDPIDTEDGSVYIYLNGTVRDRKGVYIHSDSNPLPRGKKK